MSSDAQDDESKAKSDQKGGTSAESASSPQSPQSKQDPALAKRVESAIKPVVDGSNMQVCASVIDLRTDTPAAVNGDTEMVSASMIKLIVAAAFLDHAESKKLSLDDTYTLQASDIVGGTGIIGGHGAGAAVSYRDLVTYMISVSDNTATNILIRTIGMDAVNDVAKKLGLKHTVLRRYMMDTEAIAAGIENSVSANDLAVLLQMVYKGTLVSKDSSKLMFQALEQQEDAGGIRAGLPEGTTFAHKTGTLSNARHDGGIVEGDKPYAIVVLCGGDGFSEQGAESTMAGIAKAVNAELA